MATIETLGKYEIRRTLGRGSTGMVLEGWDPSIQRRVAIKTVRIDDLTDPDTAEALNRFRREAQAAGRMVHPNVVTIHDYGETDEVAYIVMEFVEGPSLRSLLESRVHFSIPDIVRIMEGVLTGLEFSHERGIVHRDIKPANVMLSSPDITRARAKIADFGIARIESSILTQAGTIMGTPAYMAPEQFMGETIDARSDIYGAGVLLYHLLTGERPFEGTISAIMHMVLSTEAPAPSQLSVAVPPAFDAVVQRAIAKRPDQRFPSATAFLEALRVAARTAGRQPDPDVTIQGVPTAEMMTERPTIGWRLPMVGGLIALVIAAGISLAWYLITPQDFTPTHVTATAVPNPAPVTPAPVTSAPVAPAPVVPAPVALAPPPQPTADQVRGDIKRVLAELRCTMIGGDMRTSGSAVLAGIAGPGTETAVRTGLAGRAAPLNLQWEVAVAGTEFCPVLDAIRSVVPGFGTNGVSPRLTLIDDRSTLRDGDAIRPRLTLPNFGGYATVDYIARDGSVQHLYPQIGDPANGVPADEPRFLAGGERLSLGDPKPGWRGWEASEPYGTDMISGDHLAAAIRPTTTRQHGSAGDLPSGAGRCASRDPSGRSTGGGDCHARRDYPKMRQVAFSDVSAS